MVKPKELYACEYCKSNFENIKLAQFCEETDIKNKYINSNAHTEFIKGHKDLIFRLDLFIKKFKQDNNLNETEIPLKLETNNHGILIEFDPDKKFKGINFEEEVDEKKAKDLITWMKLFNLLTQKSLDIQGNRALVDRFYLLTLLNCIDNIFEEK